MKIPLELVFRIGVIGALFGGLAHTTANAQSAATVYNPAPSSTLTSSSVTFYWTPDAAAAGYWLYVGSSPGSYDIFGSAGGNGSQAVTNIPTNGSTVYVRLWTYYPTLGFWIYSDQQYGTSSGGGSPVAAVISSPVPNSTIVGSSATFSWGAAPGASYYWLYVGTSAGAQDIYTYGAIYATSQSVTTLPTTGVPIYVRLWTFQPTLNSWLYSDQQYGTSSGGTPSLAVTKSHSGNFGQGQTGATYSIVVRNIGTASTTGTVTVSDVIPSGLALTGLSGSGWNCSGASCTRSDALGVQTNYPNITATVNVAGNAPSSVTNQATVSGGGGSVGSPSNDPTTISPAPPPATFSTKEYVRLAGRVLVTETPSSGTPSLQVTKSHSGNFTQGQTAAIYTIKVRNTGGVASSGTVTVLDTIPSGLTLTGLSGTGWSCSGTSCNRSDALAAGLYYPDITATVNVANNAPASVTNRAAVSGGSGSVSGPSDDVTAVTQLVNGATVTSITTSLTNNQVNAGQSFTANVTMVNSGTRTWTPGNLYRLGSQNAQDNTTWGINRVELPVSQVLPGQSVTFAFTLTAPQAAGSYALSWKMLQDNVEWFGGTASIASITVVATAAPPTFGTISPINGSGTSGTFTFTTVSPGSSLQWLYLHIATDINTTPSCLLYYYPPSNTVYVGGDGSNQYSWAQSAVLGTGATAENSQCKLNATSSWSTVNGTNITLNLNLTFKSTFAGNKQFNLSAQNNAGYTYWTYMGSWSVPQVVQVSVSPTSQSVNSGASYQFSATVAGASNPAVTWSTNLGTVSSSGYFTANSVSSATVGYVRATSVQDASKYADSSVTVQPPAANLVVGAISPSGGSSVGWVQYSIPITGGSSPVNTLYWSTGEYGTLSSYGGCLIYYDRTTNRIYLGGNDYSYTWVDSGYLGEYRTLVGNNRCQINLSPGYSGAVQNGNDTTLTLYVNWLTGWPSYKSFYVWAQNSGGQTYGWANDGYWYLPY